MNADFSCPCPHATPDKQTPPQPWTTPVAPHESLLQNASFISENPVEATQVPSGFTDIIQTGKTFTTLHSALKPTFPSIKSFGLQANGITQPIHKAVGPKATAASDKHLKAFWELLEVRLM